MSAPAHPVPVRRGLLTPGVAFLLCVMLTGLVAGVYRFLFGLGAATNLTDQYPWGLWIGVDVASGVALAAGGFTSAAVAHVFHRRKYEVLVRPALLTAMLGYTFAVIGLTADLGRYYNIWHPVWPGMWQGNSVLFEVAMCVMVYLNVLYLEFAPIVCERFMGRVSLPGPFRVLNGLAEAVLRLANATLSKFMFLFIAAGVVLSCMHQSSLGSLLLIAPYKMSPLWYTPILPLMFLLSAVAVGFAMVIFESLLASWSLGRKPEMPVLSAYSRIFVVFLGVYGVARLSDLVIREALAGALAGNGASFMFLAEIGLGIALPFVMLLSGRVRRSPPRPAFRVGHGCVWRAAEPDQRVSGGLQAPLRDDVLFPEHSRDSRDCRAGGRARARLPRVCHRVPGAARRGGGRGRSGRGRAAGAYRSGGIVCFVSA